MNSIWGFSVYDATNNSSNSFVDNIELRSLTAPKFTMAEDPVNVTVGAQSNVSVTDVTGVISVESEDTNIATATYSNGNIVIEGVSQGVAVITVTAENDGLSTSKSFTAIVGDVATKDVTVNFFVTGTSTPVKDAVTINDVAVGATIGADDIDTETITNDIGRYTYNSSASTALPYQVSDGENVINIYYDEALAVTNLTINYKAGDQIVATGTRNLTGLYVGDTASYTDAYYVKGDDGTIYSTQGEMFTTDADETSISSTTVSQDYLKYNKTVLLTTAGSQTIEQTVEVSPNAVYFSEAEDLGLSVTTQGVNTARYIFSCGTGMRGRTGSDGIGIYEVPASGTYQIVVSGGNSRKYETAIFKSAEAAAAASSYTGEGALVSFGTTDNSVYGMYTVKTVELDKGDVLTLKGFGDKNTTYVIDYIMVRQLSTDPTATYSQIGDYTTETGTDDNGSAFTFTVTPGSETITSVGVKVNGIEADRTAATEITSGSAVFAVAVDTSADKVESITAVLNGADVEAVETTTVE